MLFQHRPTIGLAFAEGYGLEVSGALKAETETADAAKQIEDAHF